MDALWVARQRGQTGALGAGLAISTLPGFRQVMLEVQTTTAVLLIALVLDAVLGDPDWLWRRMPHPVVVMGNIIQRMDDALNQPDDSGGLRRGKGVFALLSMITIAAAFGLVVRWLIEFTHVMLALEVVIVAMLLAQRSLYEHVKRVQTAFAEGGLTAARQAVAMIVGRDPESLDEAGVCRAAIESSAENFSDGIVAPAFWYLVAGLPGMLIYKMVNTADSMIGHRNKMYAEFGWASARFDDVLNLVPARLSAVFLATAAAVRRGSAMGALRATWNDAHRHRSPNAGWPEAAMAGSLGLALAGPRVYGETVVDDPWMNASGNRQARPQDIGRALEVLVGACVVQAIVITFVFSVSVL